MITGRDLRRDDVRLTTRETVGRLASRSRHDAITELRSDEAVAPRSVITDSLSQELVERSSIRRLLIYRLTGALSVTFITDCETDGEALQKADAIAKLGYRVEVWRDGAEVRCQEMIPSGSTQCCGMHRS